MSKQLVDGDGNPRTIMGVEIMLPPFTPPLEHRRRAWATMVARAWEWRGGLTSGGLEILLEQPYRHLFLTPTRTSGGEGAMREKKDDCLVAARFSARAIFSMYVYHDRNHIFDRNDLLAHPTSFYLQIS
jgi:hypothetical protein